MFSLDTDATGNDARGIQEGKGQGDFDLISVIEKVCVPSHSVSWKPVPKIVRQTERQERETHTHTQTSRTILGPGRIPSVSLIPFGWL